MDLLIDLGWYTAKEWPVVSPAANRAVLLASIPLPPKLLRVPGAKKFDDRNVFPLGLEHIAVASCEEGLIRK